MILRNNLLRILKYRGIRTKWLVCRSGISRQQMYNIIYRKRGCNLITAIRISKALQLSIEDIWDVDELVDVCAKKG